MVEEYKKKLNRLIYQSTHRGCKETDYLLGQFAKEKLHEFDSNQLVDYEKFITQDDWDIYAWLTGGTQFPVSHDNKATKKLREYINSVKF